MRGKYKRNKTKGNMKINLKQYKIKGLDNYI